MEIKNNMREEITTVFIVVVVVSLAAHHGTAAEPIKIHLVGRDGLCLDSGGPSRYNFPKLAPCKPNEDTQLWTFPNDGTVRWTNDSCLFPYAMTEVLKQYISVRTAQCNQLQEEDKTWALDDKNGFLVHVHSSMVLTVRTNSNFVSVETNRNDPSQIWAAAVDQERDPAPRVGFIMGLHSYECLRWEEFDKLLFSEKCSLDKDVQLWALFDDGTIRVNAYRKQCMTSMHQTMPYYHMIGVFECDGKAEQQWEMDLDKFTIHHPNDSTLVMDVIKYEKEESMNRHVDVVALFTHNGASTQQWTFIE